MTSKTLACILVAVSAGACCADVSARDPGDVESTSARRGTPPGQRPPSDIIPQRIDPADLHGRPLPRPAERRRLYERVEEDLDRGNGRIEDEQAYQLRRFQDDRDERLRRIPRQRDAERFQEDYDRRRRLDAREERDRAERRESASPLQRPGTIVEPIPDRPISTLARVVADDEERLTAARQQYQADLRAAEVERDEAIRAGRTREAKAVAERRFGERRAALTREYQALRRRVLGRQ